MSVADAKSFLSKKLLILRTKMVYEEFSPYVYETFGGGSLVSSGTAFSV